MHTPPLFERLGGERSLRSVIVRMYDRILSDPVLAPFFENSDVERLRLSQTAFVTYAFGGPNHYNGASLRAAHQHAVRQGISDDHFNRVAVHLKEAMEEIKIAPELIAEALAIVESTRADVLNR